ncbi:MAG: type II toxin-antitoxin system PemK/MazF family toxin [Chitinophagaceae bacterium]
MTTGDIVLVPFPFAELTNIKVRPALVITTTKNRYKDLILCAVSSVIKGNTGNFEMLLNPDNLNKLRAISIIKIDRIITLKKERVIASLGKLSDTERKQFIKKFQALVD